MFLLNGSPFADGVGTAEGAVSIEPIAADIANGATAAANGYVPQPGGFFGFDTMTMLLIYGAIIAFFYFVVIRPQRVQAKKAKEMQAALKVGDNIVTTGGLFGTIAEVGHDCFMVELGVNKSVRIPIRKMDVLGIQKPNLTAPPTTEK